MRTDPAPGLPEGLYRPGTCFSAAELQVLSHEGVLRPLLADIYVCAALPDSPGLRALGCHALLSGGLRAHAVLCGESAAWVHLGGRRAPEKLTVITAGVYRRRTGAPLPWQVHQVALEPAEQVQLEGVSITSPLRTAGDLFLGVGTTASRRPLQLRPPPSSEELDHAEDCSARWALIRRLCLANPEQIQLPSLTEQIERQLGGAVSGEAGSGDTNSRNAATWVPESAGGRRLRPAPTNRRRVRVESLLRARVFGVAP